jgi:hypothetical protein
MEIRDPQLIRIWQQKNLPVVYHQGKGKPILFRVPFAPGNRDWVRGEHRHKPVWNAKMICWETPLAWFDELIAQSLKRFSKTYVVQVHKELQKCAPACWSASGYHCECSCMGANHGTGSPGANWREISETFAFQWGERKYACRLISAKIREERLN